MNWTIGVEIELLAPLGSTRRALADALAAKHGGHVETSLHQDSEPSKVPNQPVFYNLTQAFTAFDGKGSPLLRVVDDLTLQHDLVKSTPAKPGWWRVVSDDARLLRMLALHIDAKKALPDALEKLASLFHGDLLETSDGMYRLLDSVGAPIAIVAPLPGERERPCEIITPPLKADHQQRIDALLHEAMRMGFTVPLEGATHLHFDADALCDAHVIANIVALFSYWRARLRMLCRTPKHFRRVGEWPASLLACVGAADFRSLAWPEAQQRLEALSLSKYCDINLRNIAHHRRDCHTLEIRILPAYTESSDIIASAALFEAMLRHCMRDTVIEFDAAAEWNAAEVRDWLDTLPWQNDAREFWQARCT